MMQFPVSLPVETHKTGLPPKHSSNVYDIARDCQSLTPSANRRIECESQPRYPG